MSPRVTMRRATAADDDRLVRFLCEHWRADHVFVTHPELLRWQHYCPNDEDARTFMLAVDADAPPDALPLGVLGFMPFRRFDPATEWTSLALAIWKVRENVGTPGLGLQLLKAVERDQAPDLVAAIGISSMVRPIYEALGYSLSTMAHHMLFPAGTEREASLAQNIPPRARREVPADEGISLLRITSHQLPTGLSSSSIDALASSQMPQKSWRYICGRYLDHPWYQYEIRAVMADGELEAILIWRRVSAAGSSALRIVDIIGRPQVLARCGAALRLEILRAGSEYLDLVEHGIPANVLSTSGFVSTKECPELVLPNHFEPFESHSVAVDVAYRVSMGKASLPLHLFRADSDQDRPNSAVALAHRKDATE